MTSDQNPTIPAGWVGGFAASEPEFAYPNPDLSCLEICDNLDNIDLLQRQQKVIWPEFSWATRQDKPDEKRCYQMFAPDISRIGYTDTGKVYSIICPQQGMTSPALGSMNVEVTVTGTRGWVDETNKTLAADMSVEGKIWFSPSAMQKPKVKKLWDRFANSKLPFPSDKASAIRVRTHLPADRNQVLFPLKTGESDSFPIPDFARHPEAWTVGNLSVQIGEIFPTGNIIVDKFNQLILGIFNTASGNMLKFGNILTWNVWFTPPELVDTEEWKDHAEVWRKSINADHGSPEGEGSDPRYYDGTVFKPARDLFDRIRGRGLDEEFVSDEEMLEQEELAELDKFLNENEI